MMPSDYRHQKISIFADLDTLKREERARRRVLRIQQVRQQSKVIASQVIARTRHLREKEVCLLRQKKEQQLKDWKHQRLTELKEELNYGLEHIGSSFKAVDQELAASEERKKRKAEQERLARERGIIAAREVQQQLQEDRLREERKFQDRAEVRALEDLRAKAVASLPPSVPASVAPTSKSSSKSQSSGKRVEVYNYSQPLPNQFLQIPDNIVQRVSPSSCKVGAVEAAEKELEVHLLKEQERTEQEELISWLGGAAETRLALRKEYDDLLAKLPLLEQREAQTRPDAVTLGDIARIEREEKRKLKSQRMSQQNPVPPVTEAATQTTEPSADQQDAAVLSRQDLTAFPLAQFTAEEQGALGGTATSLYTLLSTLSDESRRRLQAVVDDEFVFNDEDFDEPSPSPPASPEPPVQTNQLTVDVKTTHQVTVEGPSSPASTITSTSEVSITVAGKSKRRKKKSKNKVASAEKYGEVTNQKMTRDVSQQAESSKHQKEDSTEKTGAKHKDHTVTKSVEIDEFGVAYIKKSATTGEKQKDQSQSFSEEVSLKYNKHSLVSNSTQYFSPPDNMLADDNIEKYLKSIEKEKEQVAALLQAKSKPTQSSKSKQTVQNIDLPKYINKLLTMTRDSVEQLSISDVTDTSSELSSAGHKKKKKKKKKTKGQVTESSSGNEASRSTEDSHVTLSAPSPGVPYTSVVTAVESTPSPQLFSSSSEDSKLKFSDSSSLKESYNNSDEHKISQNTATVSLDYDSTAYLTLQDLSSRATGKPSLVPSKVFTKPAKDTTDSSNISLPHETEEHFFRPDVPARLSTIIEADSSVADDSIRSHKNDKDESSESAIDIEAELQKRGLPTLARTEVSATSNLLSPELERQLQDMKVTPWGSNMIARMKIADSLSSSSEDGQAARLFDSNELAGSRAQQGICHSTPVSMDGLTVTEMTQSSERFFQQDDIVSPIPPVEEKCSLSS